MSPTPPSADDTAATAELDALISARLDGELDDQAWEEACQRLGPQATTALAQAQTLRGWSLDEQPPALPAALRQQIQQSLAQSPHPAATPRTTRWGPLVVLAAAAALIAALTPVTLEFLRSRQPSPYARLGRPDHSRQSVADSAEARPRRDVPAPAALPESGVQFGEAADSDQASAMASAPTSDNDDSVEAQISAESDLDATLDDHTLDALIAEAEHFRAEEDHQTARRLPRPAAPVPGQQAFADLEQATSGDERVRLHMSMAFAQGEDEMPDLIVIHLHNRSTFALPMINDLLRIEGLDAEGTVIWTYHPTPPGDQLKAGQEWDWATPLTEDELPPAPVRRLRLGYASARTTGTPWPPASPADPSESR